MRYVAILTLLSTSAWPHDIYEGVHGKNGQLCCGGSDCASTVYRERGSTYEFLTREDKWVEIPQERITFLPIPGDEKVDDTHHAHLCYRRVFDGDRFNHPENIFGDIYLYCAFIPPGAI